MKSVIKRLIESVVLIAVSAALWQIALLPVADTINKKLHLSMVQNLIVILCLGIVVILINIYSKKQGYLNWKNRYCRSFANESVYYCNYIMEHI